MLHYSILDTSQFIPLSVLNTPNLLYIIYVSLFNLKMFNTWGKSLSLEIILTFPRKVKFGKSSLYLGFIFKSSPCCNSHVHCTVVCPKYRNICKTVKSWCTIYFIHIFLQLECFLRSIKTHEQLNSWFIIILELIKASFSVVIPLWEREEPVSE